MFTLLSRNLILLQFELVIFSSSCGPAEIWVNVPKPIVSREIAEDLRICHGSAGNARWPDPCRILLEVFFLGGEGSLGTSTSSTKRMI